MCGVEDLTDQLIRNIHGPRKLKGVKRQKNQTDKKSFNVKKREASLFKNDSHSYKRKKGCIAKTFW